MSEAQIRRYKDPINRQKIIEQTTGKNNPFYGRKHTNETKEKISVINKVKWKNPEYIKKQKADGIKRFKNEDFRENNKNKNIETWKDPNLRKHVSELAISRLSDPDVRTKMSDAQKLVMTNSDNIEKSRNGAKKQWETTNIREKICRKVSMYGIIYLSMTDASKCLNISISNVQYKCNNIHNPDCFYVND